MNRMILIGTAVVLITAILLLTPNLASADSGGDGYVVSENGYQVELVFKDAAAVGENEFHIQITDSMGMPVPNAEVEVACRLAEGMSAHAETESTESHNTDSMSGMDMSTEAPATDSMNGMNMSTEAPVTGVMRLNNTSESDAHDEQAITINLEPAHESGAYSGVIALDKSGAWIFKVHFTVDGQMTAVEIPVNVVRSSSNLAVLAGFFGINATVITAAAIMKRKPILK